MTASFVCHNCGELCLVSASWVVIDADWLCDTCRDNERSEDDDE